MTDTTEVIDDAMIDPVTGEIIDQEDLAERLLAQPKEQGVSLVGPGGLLNQLTKNVLEAALDAELTEHVVDRVDQREISAGGQSAGALPERASCAEMPLPRDPVD